jgi:hypothetical protein
MAAGDVISIRGQFLEYMYIPTGIERELVRFGMDGVGIVGGGSVPFHFSGQTVFSLPHIEGIPGVYSHTFTLF